MNSTVAVAAVARGGGEAEVEGTSSVDGSSSSDSIIEKSPVCMLAGTDLEERRLDF